MAVAVKIFVDGTLAWSPQPGAANPPVVVKAFNTPNSKSFFGFALIELQADQGEFFVTVTPDASDGVLTLYGAAEDRRVTTESLSPVGLLVSLQGGVEQPRPSPGRYLSLAFHDATGASLGSFKFQFVCKALPQEALFRVKRGRLPELEAEPRRATSLVFDIETLQPATNSVAYVLKPWTMPRFAFSHGLQQTANRYAAPDGPLVDAAYFGVPAVEDTEVFLLTGTDTQGAEQTIPFISWLYDTPARGELRIVAIDPDPQGADAGAESITLANASTRSFSVARCYLEDEQPISLFGATLNLPYGAPGRHIIPQGRLNPGDQLVVKPSFSMNNDFDSFTLRNRRGRTLDRMAYIRRLPGMPPPATPRQRVVFRGTVSLTAAVDQDSVRLTSVLEDGDMVLIRPDPASKLWAGEIPHPATGPEGWFRPNGQPEPAPAGWALPLPSAPVYALLMIAAPEPRLIGNTAHRIVIDRQSKTNDGLAAGSLTIAFQRNDPSFGRIFAWGQFDIEVIVLRH